MRRTRKTSGGNGEQGVVITLVALFVLFVVGAMAALSIDVVTLYTARSEAQLAADGAALAGARVLANSGMTSNVTNTTLATNAEALALTVATQVATHNLIGGRTLNVGAGEVAVSFSGPPTNPQVTVHVSRADLPTFFARIWGSTQVAVAASATAEAYNPSGGNALGVNLPVAPTCVKPWLLPNMDPSSTTSGTIFNATSGTITNPALLGWTSSAATPTPVPMTLGCVGGTPPRLSGNCSTSPPLPGPSAWGYYPGDDTTFPHPTQSLPSCGGGTLNNYQLSVAGCVQTPISCNSTVQIDTSIDLTRDLETANAANCLTRATANPGDADQVDLAASPIPPPFQFLAGNQNPVAGAVGNDVLVSSSLVTVPVFDSGPGLGWKNSGSVQIIGFVQLFLSPNAVPVPVTGPAVGHVNTTVINMAGCGSGATGTPIQGNGASPVAVRLVSER